MLDLYVEEGAGHLGEPDKKKQQEEVGGRGQKEEASASRTQTRRSFKPVLTGN